MNLIQSEIPYPRLNIDCYKNMKLNFVLPTEAESFERIHYIELDEMKSRKVVVLNNQISMIWEHPLMREKNFL